MSPSEGAAHADADADALAMIGFIAAMMAKYKPEDLLPIENAMDHLRARARILRERAEAIRDA